MTLLIYLVLFGLVVALAPFILQGAALLLYSPFLLALLLTIIPATRLFGIGFFVIWGVVITVKDEKEKNAFVRAAKASGLKRKDINRLIKAKKPNDSWAVYTQQYLVSLNPPQTPQVSIEPVRETVELTQAEKTKLVAGMKADSELCQAVYTVIENGTASTSLLQRRLIIGYGKAAKLIEEMEDLGVIGEQDGSRPRSVHIDVFQGMPTRPLTKSTAQTETYDFVA